MARKNIAQRISAAKRFGRAVLQQINRLKTQAQTVSGPITRVLHELEGKLLRATGIVAKGGKKGRPKKTKVSK